MKIIAALICLLPFSVFAGQSNYYPDSFVAQKASLQNEELKQALFEVMDKAHIYLGPNKRDILVDSCGDNNGSGRCSRQKVLGYNTARKLLFGKIHLEEGSQGYYITDVYCRKNFTQSSGVGPDRIPNNNQINCEHTWPQSKFTKNFPNEMQKSDLHHLYPTDSRANAIRGNNEFAEVDGEPVEGCEPSYYGKNKVNEMYFEPPNEHKGNVARALFYFSVRYKIGISSQQEAYLRKWHEQDPVDAEEMERNDLIEKIQGNRNPFTDQPELVSQIQDF
ncbi:MAG: hypothetical protein Fur0010_07680 [Bdellovibrio sp.]